MIRVIFLICVLILSLNVRGTELLNYFDIFSSWKVEIATSLWEKDHKTISLYEEPNLNLNMVCSTIVREIEASPTKGSAFSIEDEKTYKLFSSIGETKNIEYCKKGPFTNWFQADISILPEEVIQLKNIFNFNSGSVKIQSDIVVNFELPGTELKKEFESLQYESLMEVTVSETEEGENLLLIFNSKGGYYKTITLEFFRKFNKEDEIKIFGAQ